MVESLANRRNHPMNQPRHPFPPPSFRTPALPPPHSALPPPPHSALPPPSYLQSLNRHPPTTTTTTREIVLMQYSPDHQTMVEGVCINISMMQKSKIEVKINYNADQKKRKRKIKSEPKDVSIPPPIPPPPAASPMMGRRIMPYMPSFIPGVHACGHPISALRPVLPVAPMMRRYYLI